MCEVAPDCSAELRWDGNIVECKRKAGEKRFHAAWSSTDLTIGYDFGEVGDGRKALRDVAQ
jgi:hypothetical protein